MKNREHSQKHQHITRQENRIKQQNTNNPDDDSDGEERLPQPHSNQSNIEIEPLGEVSTSSVTVEKHEINRLEYYEPEVSQTSTNRPSGGEQSSEIGCPHRHPGQACCHWKYTEISRHRRRTYSYPPTSKPFRLYPLPRSQYGRSKCARCMTSRPHTRIAGGAQFGDTSINVSTVTPTGRNQISSLVDWVKGIFIPTVADDVTPTEAGNDIISENHREVQEDTERTNSVLLDQTRPLSLMMPATSSQLDCSLEFPIDMKNDQAAQGGEMSPSQHLAQQYSFFPITRQESRTTETQTTYYTTTEQTKSTPGGPERTGEEYDSQLSNRTDSYTPSGSGTTYITPMESTLVVDREQWMSDQNQEPTLVAPKNERSRRNLRLTPSTTGDSSTRAESISPDLQNHKDAEEMDRFAFRRNKLKMGVPTQMEEHNIQTESQSMSLDSLIGTKKSASRPRSTNSTDIEFELNESGGVPFATTSRGALETDLNPTVRNSEHLHTCQLQLLRADEAVEVDQTEEALRDLIEPNPYTSLTAVETLSVSEATDTKEPKQHGHQPTKTNTHRSDELHINDGQDYRSNAIPTDPSETNWPTNKSPQLGKQQSENDEPKTPDPPMNITEVEEDDEIEIELTQQITIKNGTNTPDSSMIIETGMRVLSPSLKFEQKFRQQVDVSLSPTSPYPSTRPIPGRTTPTTDVRAIVAPMETYFADRFDKPEVNADREELETNFSKVSSEKNRPTEIEQPSSLSPTTVKQPGEDEADLMLREELIASGLYETGAHEGSNTINPQSDDIRQVANEIVWAEEQQPYSETPRPISNLGSPKSVSSERQISEHDLSRYELGATEEVVYADRDSHLDSLNKADSESERKIESVIDIEQEDNTGVAEDLAMHGFLEATAREDTNEPALNTGFGLAHEELIENTENSTGKMIVKPIEEKDILERHVIEAAQASLLSEGVHNEPSTNILDPVDPLKDEQKPDTSKEKESTSRTEAMKNLSPVVPENVQTSKPAEMDNDRPPHPLGFISYMDGNFPVEVAQTAESADEDERFPTEPYECEESTNVMIGQLPKAISNETPDHIDEFDRTNTNPITSQNAIISGSSVDDHYGLCDKLAHPESSSILPEQVFSEPREQTTPGIEFGHTPERTTDDDPIIPSPLTEIDTNEDLVESYVEERRIEPLGTENVEKGYEMPSKVVVESQVFCSGEVQVFSAKLVIQVILEPTQSGRAIECDQNLAVMESIRSESVSSYRSGSTPQSTSSDVQNRRKLIVTDEESDGNVRSEEEREVFQKFEIHQSDSKLTSLVDPAVSSDITSSPSRIKYPTPESSEANKIITPDPLIEQSEVGNDAGNEDSGLPGIKTLWQQNERKVPKQMSQDRFPKFETSVSLLPEHGSLVSLQNRSLADDVSAKFMPSELPSESNDGSKDLKKQSSPIQSIEQAEEILEIKPVVPTSNDTGRLLIEQQKQVDKNKEPSSSLGRLEESEKPIDTMQPLGNLQGTTTIDIDVRMEYRSPTKSPPVKSLFKAEIRTTDQLVEIEETLVRDDGYVQITEDGMMLMDGQQLQSEKNEHLNNQDSLNQTNQIFNENWGKSEWTTSTPRKGPGGQTESVDTSGREMKHAQRIHFKSTSPANWNTLDNIPEPDDETYGIEFISHRIAVRDSGVEMSSYTDGKRNQTSLSMSMTHSDPWPEQDQPQKHVLNTEDSPSDYKKPSEWSSQLSLRSDVRYKSSPQLPTYTTAIEVHKEDKYKRHTTQSPPGRTKKISPIEWAVSPISIHTTGSDSGLPPSPIEHKMTNQQIRLIGTQNITVELPNNFDHQMKEQSNSNLPSPVDGQNPSDMIHISVAQNIYLSDGTTGTTNDERPMLALPSTVNRTDLENGRPYSPVDRPTESSRVEEARRLSFTAINNAWNQLTGRSTVTTTTTHTKEGQILSTNKWEQMISDGQVHMNSVIDVQTTTQSPLIFKHEYDGQVSSPEPPTPPASPTGTGPIKSLSIKRSIQMSPYPDATDILSMQQESIYTLPVGENPGDSSLVNQVNTIQGENILVQEEQQCEVTGATDYRLHSRSHITIGRPSTPANILLALPNNQPSPTVINDTLGGTNTTQEVKIDTVQSVDPTNTMSKTSVHISYPAPRPRTNFGTTSPTLITPRGPGGQTISVTQEFTVGRNVPIRTRIGAGDLSKANTPTLKLEYPMQTDRIGSQEQERPGTSVRGKTLQETDPTQIRDEPDEVEEVPGIVMQMPTTTKHGQTWEGMEEENSLTDGASNMGVHLATTASTLPLGSEAYIGPSLSTDKLDDVGMERPKIEETITSAENTLGANQPQLQRKVEQISESVILTGVELSKLDSKQSHEEGFSIEPGEKSITQERSATLRSTTEQRDDRISHTEEIVQDDKLETEKMEAILAPHLEKHTTETQGESERQANLPILTSVDSIRLKSREASNIDSILSTHQTKSGPMLFGSDRVATGQELGNDIPEVSQATSGINKDEGVKSEAMSMSMTMKTSEQQQEVHSEPIAPTSSIMESVTLQPSIKQTDMLDRDILQQGEALSKASEQEHRPLSKEDMAALSNQDVLKPTESVVTADDVQAPDKRNVIELKVSEQEKKGHERTRPDSNNVPPLTPEQIDGRRVDSAEGPAKVDKQELRLSEQKKTTDSEQIDSILVKVPSSEAIGQTLDHQVELKADASGTAGAVGEQQTTGGTDNLGEINRTDAKQVAPSEQIQDKLPDAESVPFTDTSGIVGAASELKQMPESHAVTRDDTGAEQTPISARDQQDDAKGPAMLGAELEDHHAQDRVRIKLPVSQTVSEIGVVEDTAVPTDIEGFNEDKGTRQTTAEGHMETTLSSVPDAKQQPIESKLASEQVEDQSDVEATIQGAEPTLSQIQLPGSEYDQNILTRDQSQSEIHQTEQVSSVKQTDVPSEEQLIPQTTLPEHHALNRTDTEAEQSKISVRDEQDDLRGPAKLETEIDDDHAQDRILIKPSINQAAPETELMEYTPETADIDGLAENKEAREMVIEHSQTETTQISLQEVKQQLGESKLASEQLEDQSDIEVTAPGAEQPLSQLQLAGTEYERGTPIGAPSLAESHKTEQVSSAKKTNAPGVEQLVTQAIFTGPELPGQSEKSSNVTQVTTEVTVEMPMGQTVDLSVRSTLAKVNEHGRRLNQDQTSPVESTPPTIQIAPKVGGPEELGEEISVLIEEGASSASIAQEPNTIRTTEKEEAAGNEQLGTQPESDQQPQLVGFTVAEPEESSAVDHKLPTSEVAEEKRDPMRGGMLAGLREMDIRDPQSSEIDQKYAQLEPQKLIEESEMRASSFKQTVSSEADRSMAHDSKLDIVEPVVKTITTPQTDGILMSLLEIGGQSIPNDYAVQVAVQLVTLPESVITRLIELGTEKPPQKLLNLTDVEHEKLKIILSLAYQMNSMVDEARSRFLEELRTDLQEECDTKSSSQSFMAVSLADNLVVRVPSRLSGSMPRTPSQSEIHSQSITPSNRTDELLNQLATTGGQDLVRDVLLKAGGRIIDLDDDERKELSERAQMRRLDSTNEEERKNLDRVIQITKKAGEAITDAKNSFVDQVMKDERSTPQHASKSQSDDNLSPIPQRHSSHEQSLDQRLESIQKNDKEGSSSRLAMSYVDSRHTYSDISDIQHDAGRQQHIKQLSDRLSEQGSNRDELQRAEPPETKSTAQQQTGKRKRGRRTQEDSDSLDRNYMKRIHKLKPKPNRTQPENYASPIEVCVQRANRIGSILDELILDTIEYVKQNVPSPKSGRQKESE